MERGKNFFKYQNQIWKLVREIRSQRFDIVLDFQGLIRSAFFTAFSGAKKRVGFSNARELAFLAYNEKIGIYKDMHAVERYAILASSILKKKIKGDFTFPISDKNKKRACTLTKTHHILFLYQEQVG